MKIGITCSTIVFPDNNRIFSNGHHFNVLLWYHFFEKCGFQVIFVSDKENTGTVTNGGNSYNIVNYTKFWDNNEELVIQSNLDPEIVLKIN